MQNNDSNNYLDEDVIDLTEIFKSLINSKKLIITITLVITTLGAIYSFQKAPEYQSNALIEIGIYDQDKQILIEPVLTLHKELTINFIHKQGLSDLEFDVIQDKLIRIHQTSSSSSSVTSKNLVNGIIRYIDNRHSLLLSNHIKKAENQLTYKIKSLNDQIEFSNKALLSQLTNKIIILNNELPNIDSKIESLNEIIESLNEIIDADQNNLLLLKSDPKLFIQRASQSPTLDQVIHSYKNQLLDLSQEKDSLELELKLLDSKDLESDEIFNLSQEKDSLELELEFLMNQNPTSTQLIGEIVTNTIDLKRELFILMSFIFGLFLSIVIVLINNSLKAFKDK